MSGFRGSDAALEREIAALERMGRTRVRRAAAELHDLERNLRELRKERARRQSSAVAIDPLPATADEPGVA